MIRRYRRVPLIAGLSFLLLPSTPHVYAGGPGDPVAANMAKLEGYVAEWRVTERHFDARGKEVALVKSTEAIIWILDRHAIQRSYTTITNDVVSYAALGTLTWSEAEKKYHGVWFDTASNAGPTVVKADWNADERKMVYTLEAVGDDGRALRHRVVERFVDGEHRTATTFRLVDDGGVVKVLEVTYERTTPCPSRQMRVIDELNP